MNYQEHRMLSSEINQLESLLSKISENRVLERMGLEARLKSARHKINNIDLDTLRKKAVVTFRGQPVVGSHGIVADFAAKAAGSFTEAISAVAAGLSGDLSYMGPIPNRNQNHLLITGTAVGSFGFEFEVPKAEENSLFPGTSDAEVALEKMQSLFQMAMDGNDDALTELVDEIHPRAVKKAVDFLDVLKSNSAWFAMEFREHTFRFSDVNQVQMSIDKLSDDNIREETEQYNGKFQGILPSSRTFEFKAGDEIIKGKIGPMIGDPNILNQEYLDQAANITLHVTQVGQGKPRYTLLSLDQISLI